MNWDQLLSAERVRELLIGEKTDRKSDEIRTEVQRDYGRAIFSTPVRRLQDKAQVFPMEPIDAVRTRLTHSLEVSSVARDMAIEIAAQLERKGVISPVQARDIETIGATCGLIHDLGNPPFGHAGEQAIQSWFKDNADFVNGLPDQYRQDLDLFEGNAQTIRLISKLQVLSDRFGLNFTAATFSAAAKYSASSTEVDPDSEKVRLKKLGYFQSESEVVNIVREKTGTGERRNPVTLIVEAADDIVYSVVDLEDAIKKGVIRWDEIEDILEQSIDSVGEELLGRTSRAARAKIQKASVILDGQGKDEGISQYFRTFTIGFAVPAVCQKFIQEYDAIMKGEFEKELLYETSAGALYKILKNEIGRKRVYQAKATLRLEVLGRNVIHDLMKIFWRPTTQPNPAHSPGKYTDSCPAITDPFLKIRTTNTGVIYQLHIRRPF